MRLALPRTRRQRIFIEIGALCLISLLSACSYWRIWSYEDHELHLRMRHHSPVAHALWHGKIRPGDRIDRVIAMARPNRIENIGPFLRIYYYPGGGTFGLECTSLTAKDGRLMGALTYGCTFQRTFFDVSTADDDALYGRLVRARIKARSEATRLRPPSPPPTDRASLRGS